MRVLVAVAVLCLSLGATTQAAALDERSHARVDAERWVAAWRLALLAGTPAATARICPLMSRAALAKVGGAGKCRAAMERIARSLTTEDRREVQRLRIVHIVAKRVGGLLYAIAETNIRYSPGEPFYFTFVKENGHYLYRSDN